MKHAISILALILALGAVAACVHAAPLVIDTTHPGWIWNGMSEYDDPAIGAGQGRAGGPGSYGAYTFNGQSVSVAMMQAPSITVDGRPHRVGKVQISIDGAPKATPRVTGGGVAGNYVVYTTNTLTSGNHVLQLTAVDGWVVVDHITVQPDGSDLAPKGNAAHQNAFHDDFRNGDVSAWAPYGGDWSVTGGYYTVTSGTGNKSLVSGSNYSDFAYQADVVVAGQGGDAGLIFRVTEPSVGTDAYNGYYAGIDVAQQRIVLGKASNSWTILATVPFHAQAMTPYHLRVDAVGQNITVSVGNVPVIRFGDDTYPSGAVGVRTYDVDAGWTNVDVSPQ